MAPKHKQAGCATPAVTVVSRPEVVPGAKTWARTCAFNPFLVSALQRIS